MNMVSLPFLLFLRNMLLRATWLVPFLRRLFDGLGSCLDRLPNTQRRTDLVRVLQDPIRVPLALLNPTVLNFLQTAGDPLSTQLSWVAITHNFRGRYLSFLQFRYRPQQVTHHFVIVKAARGQWILERGKNVHHSALVVRFPQRRPQCHTQIGWLACGSGNGHIMSWHSGFTMVTTLFQLAMTTTDNQWCSMHSIVRHQRIIPLRGHITARGRRLRERQPQERDFNLPVSPPNNSGISTYCPNDVADTLGIHAFFYSMSYQQSHY